MHGWTRRQVCCLLMVVATVPQVALSASKKAAPLAIKGYDPVAYFTLGKPTPGVAELEYEWDGHRWRFANAEHRDLFRADPLRYAPQFGSLCAMALTRGQVIEADPQFWMIAEGKLFLFGVPDGPEAFRKNLAENIDKASRAR